MPAIRSVVGHIRARVVQAMVIMMTGAMAYGVHVLNPRLLITVSPSVDGRVFWRTGKPPDAKHDFVTFWITHRLAGPEPVRLTKRLNCWPGEVLSIRGRDYYCNGAYLGRAKLLGRDGQKLPRLTEGGRIPNGYAFASGFHPDSFDSRYWGLVEIAQTERLIRLVGRLP